jgi:hypothetical protein
MTRRIVIIGGPHVGKTTLSHKLQSECGFENVHHSDDIKHLDWSASSEFASHWFDSEDEYVAEGVQMARALRKWLQNNPGKSLDVDIVWLTKPQTSLLPGQINMAKGVMTVFNEIRGELEKRGARIYHLRDPDEALQLFHSSWAGDSQQRKPMLIEYTKEQYDALPQAQQKLCAEKDGKYTFEFETPTEVAGLRKNKTELLYDLKKAQEALDGYKGIDPAKYAELVKAQEDAERAALEGKGQWQVLEQQLKDQAAQREKQLVEKHEADMKVLLDEKKSISSALEEKLVDSEVLAVLAGHSSTPELLMPHFKSRVKVFNEDGKYVARVVDAKGNPEIGDAQGTPKTIAQLRDEMKVSPSYMRGFDANPNGGGGATNNGNGLALGADLSKLSPVERLKAANKATAA